MISSAITQRHQIRLTRVDVANEIGACSKYRLGLLAIDRECPCIQLHSYGLMTDLPNHLCRFTSGSHEISAVAWRVGLKANQDTVRFGDVSETPEERDRHIHGLLIGQTRTIPVLWRAKDDSACSQTRTNAAYSGKMLEQRISRILRAKDIQARCAEQQSLHAGDFYATLKPPGSDTGNVLVSCLARFGEIFAWSDINCVHTMAPKQGRYRVVLGGIPGDI
jgi:hypothetical protein